MNRRTFLKTSFVPAAAATVPGWALAGNFPRLRDVAAHHGLLAGSAVSYAELHDSGFTELLSAQASIVVPENEMKWGLIHPEPNRFDFERGDALVSFAASHGQKVRGHNLCWHNQMPAWFAQTATRENAAELLHRHVSEVAGHFAGRIHSWDVVNEAVHIEDGREDGLRNSMWLQLLGPDYIGVAYRAAASADPKALLTYNDYDIEQGGPKFDAKRDAVLRLLTSMREQDIPIHALGLQSHLRASAKPPDWTALHRFMEAAEKLKLDIFVTELDVDDSDLTGTVEERDRMVGKLYGNYLSNVLQHRSVKAVLTWGLTDRDSWLNSAHRRKGGRVQRPLPFDSDLKPKPAFDAMLDAMGAAPARG